MQRNRLFMTCLALLAGGGCTAEADTTITGTTMSASPETCGPGALETPAGCQAAGTRADGCPAGRHRDADGACIAAGIPSGACAEGFVSDGQGACAPLLPDQPCSNGMLAIPGEGTCHPVATCPDSQYSAAPPGVAVEHVNAAYAGAVSTGDEATPWKTIQEAVDAAADGAHVLVAAGTYLERVDIAGKAVHLAGTCPAEVTIDGEMKVALVIHPDATGTSVERISLTGQKGVLAGGVTGVTLSHLWIHDTSTGGVSALDLESGPAEVTLVDSLVEDCAGTGLAAAGSTLTVERSAVRGTYQTGLSADALSAEEGLAPGLRSTLKVYRSIIEYNEKHAAFARGSDVHIEGSLLRGSQGAGGGLGVLGITAGDGSPSSVTVRASVLEDLRDWGLGLVGSGGALERSVVRRTRVASVAVDHGAVVIVVDSGEPPRAGKLSVVASVIDDNDNIGVAVIGAEAVITDSVVSRTRPVGTDHGLGIAAIYDSGSPASIEVHGVTITESHGTGVLALGASATLDGCIVSDTSSPSGDAGYGVAIEEVPGGAAASGSLDGVVVEGNRGVGVFVGGATATLRGTRVAGTLPLEASATFGSGVVARSSPVSGTPSSLDMQGCAIEANHHTGVLVASSAASATDIVVRGTMPQTSDGAFGDGWATLAGGDDPPFVSTITGSRLESNARAGVAVFGARAVVTDTEILCNGISLNADDYLGASASFDGSTRNVCSCAREDCNCMEVVEDCQILQSRLTAPIISVAPRESSSA